MGILKLFRMYLFQILLIALAGLKLECDAALDIPAIKKCCQNMDTKCCYDKIIKGTAFPCESQKNWKETAICLEKEYHNVSLVQAEIMGCCWLLRSETCQKMCHTMMRTPTLSVESRLMLRNDCFVNNARPESENCADEGLWKRHLCYPQCVALTSFKIQQDPGFKFDVVKHCSHFSTVPSNICVGPQINK